LVGDLWQSAHAALGGGTLSVVMPVYHLADSIEANLAKVDKLLGQSGIRYELVPVDDGSGDGTADALRRFACQWPNGRYTPVILEKNGGKGNALKAGFRASHGALILLLDGDLDILPGMLPRFFDSMVKNGSDVVVGSKRHPRSKVQYPWHRRLASWTYFTLVKWFIGMPITDTQTGMKLFRRKFLGEALDRMLVKTYAFDLELLAIAYGRGAKISEAPVVIRFGTKFGAMKPRTVYQMAKDSLAVFYRLRWLNYYAHVEVPPPSDATPLVSVVIACPNTSWMLDECLAALDKQTYRRFEAIVLPDAAFEPNPAYADWLMVLPTGKVRPAEKRNLGIEKARGEIVAFIDDDAYPDSHWLENAIKYFSEPTVGGVGGPGVTPPGDGFWARAGGRVYENVFVSGNYRYRYLGGRVRKDVDDYPSCNLFVRTDLLRQIGGYRTDFWPGEDTLLCEAIVCEAKRRIVYDPWTIVYHHRRRLFLPHLRQLGRYGFHRGYFVKRYPATSCKLSYFIPTLWLLGVVLGGALVACVPWLPLRIAYFAVLGLYAALTIATSASFRPLMWLATWLGIAASHLWYGWQFLRGLCAGKAPCEFIGKDHA